MRITQVSESTFTVKGHGVHTAFTELVEALKSQPNTHVSVNTIGPADITHIHTIGLFSLFFLLFGRGKKVVSAHIVPASLKGSIVGAKYWLPFVGRYLRWFYNHADVVFAVSEATKRELISMGVRQTIEVVHNIVNTERYRTTLDDKHHARKTLHIAPDAWLVVGAGQVQPRKRIDSFIEAARRLPNMQFIWVGGMPFGKLAAENSSMKYMIDSAPENLRFTGVIDHAKVRAYYQAGDVFWLPSEQETFGLVVVEAAAAGLPVMLRDIADYKETFADSAIMERDETFIPALQRLQTDKTYYKHAVERSRSIADTFSSVQCLERVMNVYHSLLR